MRSAKMALLVINVTCGKHWKCSNVKHLVMVPEPTHYILWIPLENPLPIWCSTPLPFAAIHRRASQARKHVYDNARNAGHRGSRAPTAQSRPNDNAGSDGFCCGLPRLGLYLSGNPHWNRIVSAADPGGTPPHYRGPVPLPYSSQEDRDHSYRR